MTSKNRPSTVLCKIHDEPIVQLAIIYNVFDTSDIEKHELVFVENQSLDEYLTGLPKDVTWGVGVNGVPVEECEFKSIIINKGDMISLAVVPEGSDGAKSVLRIVAMIAVVVLSYGVATGEIALLGITSEVGMMAAGAVIGAGGAMLINALLPMRLPTMADNTEQTKTYGVDGAKNGASEGVTVPIVYGEYRIGGNFVDIYTTNSGDTQVLFVRNAVCDGKIESVSEPLINDQPVDHFSNVDWHFSLGTNTDATDQWFPSAIRMQNKGQKITGSGIVHLATGDLDRVRFDVIFPKGLVTINEKDGKYTSRSVSFEFHYSVPGANIWVPLPVAEWQKISGFTTPVDTNRICAIVSSDNYTQGVNYILRYRLVGAPSWTVWKAENVSRTFVNRGWHSYGDYSQYQAREKRVEITLPPGEYEVDMDQASSGAALDRIEIIRSGSNTASHTDSKTGTRRISFETASIPRGTYDIRIKRLTAEGNNDKTILDEAYLADVAEIDDHPVALVNTATASMRIKLTDQLSGVPKITWKVRTVLQEYDEFGALTVERFSANPAWIVLDMLIGEQRGVGFPAYRIDFPAFFEWAQYCVDNNLTFNGTFDAASNLWDAMTVVMRVGHATNIRSGIKLSLAIEGSTSPSMMFGATAIIKDSFSIRYHSGADRANEIEATYFDRDNYNKAVTIRVVDPEAERLNLPQRVATMSLFGVDNHDQAVAEVWRQVYSNRYIKRTCSFRSPVEAIGVTIGDVALLQHDMTDWAVSGRLESGSTTLSLNLDRPVTMSVGKSYSVMAHYPAIKNYDSSVQSIIGQTVYVTGIPSSPDKITRLVQGSIDVAVTSVQWGSPLTALSVDGDVSALLYDLCELWLTDAMFERSVTLNVGDQSVIDIPVALPEIPTSGFQWLFGETVNIKKPYRLVAINGAGFKERTLKFVEYNEAVYALPERVIPPDATLISDIVNHVTNLEINYDRRQTGDSASVHTFLKWNSVETAQYAGADIYMKLNDAEWRAVSTVLNVNEFYIALSPEDRVDFKIIAFNQKGYRASSTDAPIISRDIFIERFDLDPPINLNVVNDYWKSDAGVTVTWGAPVADARVADYQIEWRCTTLGLETDWIPVSSSVGFEVKILGLYVGTYEFRVRSRKNYSYSAWVVFPLVIGSPDIVAIPTGLKLFNGTPDVPTDAYLGKDAEWSWDEASFNVDSGRDYYFLDYLVTIKDTNENVIRQESAQEARYTYTYEKNLADHLGVANVIARRTFKIEVQSRGRQGQVSAPRIMTVDNAKPNVPLGIDVQGGLNTTYVSYIKPDDSDFVGVQVYLGYAPGFIRDASTLVYEGSDNLIILNTPGASGDMRYVRIRPYDAFGKDALNESSESSATNIDLVVDVNMENWATDGIQISAQSIALDRVSWTAGTIHVEKGDVRTAYSIDAGEYNWTAGTVYIYFDKVGTTLKVSSSIVIATGIGKRVMAVYKGGTKLQVSMGDVIIDGSNILANTVAAGQLVTNQAVITGAAQIQDGIITNAKIGNIIQSADWNDISKTGWKIDKTGAIQANAITIYDATGNVILSAGTTSADILNSELTAAIDAAALSSSWSGVVGVGKPSDNADVTNYADVQIANNKIENNVLIIPHPGGAQLYVPGNGNTGAIKVALPVTWNGAMIRFFIDVYNYTSGSSFSVEVSGYLYAGGVTWSNYSARIIGGSNTNHAIRFGHDGANCCVWIGELAASWNYLQVTVRDFRASYSNFAISTWKDGWVTSLVASFTGVVNAVVSNALVSASDTVNVSGVAAATIADSSTRAQAGLDALGKIKQTVPAVYIPSLTVDKLASGTMGAVIDLIGASRLNMSLGGYVFKMGLGFGSSNQFFFWYGPDVAESAMTMTNALVAFSTSGDVKLSGTIFAGAMSTSLTSSDLSATALIEIGPFGSLGGVIAINYSYTYSGSTTTGIGVSVPGDLISDTTSAWNSCTIYVEEYYGGAWVIRSTHAVTGTVRQRAYYDPEPGRGAGTFYEYTMSGYGTYSDMKMSTADRQYRTRIVRTSALVVPNVEQRTGCLSQEG